MYKAYFIAWSHITIYILIDGYIKDFRHIALHTH